MPLHAERLILFESDSFIAFRKEHTSNNVSSSKDNTSQYNTLLVNRVTTEITLCTEHATDIFISNNSNLQSNTQLQSSSAPSSTNAGYQMTIIDGLLGAIRLNSGLFFLVVTGKDLVGSIAGFPIWRASAFKLLPSAPTQKCISASQASDDRRYQKLLLSLLTKHSFSSSRKNTNYDSKNTGGIYFCYDMDLCSEQGIASQLMNSRTLKERPSNSRFTYNKHAIDTLLEKFSKGIQSQGEQLTQQRRTVNDTSDGTEQRLTDIVRSFMLPVIQGFVGIKELIPELSSDPSKDTTINSASGPHDVLALFSRRDDGRSGRRYHCRGAAANGAVANCVETEEILLTASSKVYSFRQVRGSIPLLWSQPVNLKYKPSIRFGNGSTDFIATGTQSVNSNDACTLDTLYSTEDVFGVPAGKEKLLFSYDTSKEDERNRSNSEMISARMVFARHFARLKQSSCLSAQGTANPTMLLINLIDDHKGEGKLAAAYSEAVRQWNQKQTATSQNSRSSSPSSRTTVAESIDDNVNLNLDYIHFDFHAECKQHGWSILESFVSEQLSTKLLNSIGWTAFNLSDESTAIRVQKGMVRTNCIDNLDRTNVIQSIIARFIMLYVLAKHNETDSSSSSVDPLPLSPDYPLSPAQLSLIAAHKLLWADNGDAISHQYAGTGALKADYTRLGRRTLAGVAADGYKSLYRYISNNLLDGRVQDACDLWSGRWQVRRGIRSPFMMAARRRPLWVTAIHWLLKALIALALLELTALLIFGRSDSLRDFFRILCLLAVVVAWIIKCHGRRFVVLPCLIVPPSWKIEAKAKKTLKAKRE